MTFSIFVVYKSQQVSVRREKAGGLQERARTISQEKMTSTTVFSFPVHAV